MDVTYRIDKDILYIAAEGRIFGRSEKHRRYRCSDGVAW